jgi:transposase
MEWVGCVGIDWAEKEHTYAARARSGESFAGRFGSSPDELHEWARGLRARFGDGPIVVAVEQGRGSLVYALSMYEFILVPINPSASKSYRDSLRLSHASSDPADAVLIRDFAIKHLDELRVWRPDDPVTRRLRLLIEHRRRLVDQRTSLTHTLAATLKHYFPQALEWLGGESSHCLWAFIRRWPTLESMQQATCAQLKAMLRAQRRQHADAVGEKLFSDLRAATPLITDAAIIEPCALYAQSLVAMLLPLNEQIDTHDQTTAAAWADHADRAMFESLPGAGAVMAPRLAVAFGLDRDRYDTAGQLQCYSGIAPVVEASGKQRWTHKRYGYPKFLHQTFHEFAQCSIPRSRWARAFYLEQRSRGAGHHEAIRSLAFRWIRILFRLWKTNETYDEQRYIDVLIAKQSPLAARLAA